MVVAQLILHELSRHLGYCPPPLLERVAEEAQNIHQERPILQELLTTAMHQTIECQVKTDGLQLYLNGV